MKYILFTLFTTIVLAGSDKHFTKNGIGTDGYDLVSYFQDGPTKGSKKFSVIHDGIPYHFKNQNNLDKFKKSPAKYLPQYNGWCAYAIADGPSLTVSNPKTYWIHEGKLYLFYDKYFINTLSSWKKAPLDNLKKAEANWNNKTIK